MTTTQVAVLMPALLFWIMLIVQFGLWYHAKQIADTAAAEGVEIARAPTGTAADGETAARTVLAQAGNLRDPDIEVDRNAELVVATVSGGAPQLVPGFAWTVHAEAHGPVERFVSEADRP